MDIFQSIGEKFAKSEDPSAEKTVGAILSRDVRVEDWGEKLLVALFSEHPQVITERGRVGLSPATAEKIIKAAGKDSPDIMPEEETSEAGDQDKATQIKLAQAATQQAFEQSPAQQPKVAPRN